MNIKMIKIVAVFVVAIGVIFFITNNYHSGITKSTRLLERNTAKEILLHSGFTYKVGEEISPGYYDISYLESGKNEKMTLNAISLSKGDMMYNIPFEKGFEFTLFVEDVNADGQGKLKLTPSSFEPFKEDKEGKILLQHSGYYVVGQEIPAGKYDVILSLNEYEVDSRNLEIFMEVYKDLSLRKVISNYQFLQDRTTKIVLHENEVVYFSNIIEGLDYEYEGNLTNTHSFESDHTIVTLIKDK